MNGGLYCPLCNATDATAFHHDRRREYWQCRNCALVFVPPHDHLSAGEEKAEYDLHRNAIDDPGYRRFLSRVADPLLSKLAPGALGLDFGCGPGPALACMLEEAGCAMRLYDVFYFPDASVLEREYDFITATEVVEHLHQPGEELTRLWGMIVPGGYLGLMTKLVIDAPAFSRWHYKDDPTHVCFFSEATLAWWARQAGADLERIGADVAILRKRVLVD